MRPRFPFGLLFNPPLVGALGLSALVVFAADGEAERAALIGVFVEKNPSPSATVLMGTALVAGVVLGLLGDVLVLGRDHRAGRAFRPTGRRAMRACLVAASLHAFFMACAMVRLPHRYASWFYDRGGVLRTVQVLVTDVFGRAGVLALGCACLFLYLAGPRTVVRRPSEQGARVPSPWKGKATEALQGFLHRRWGRLFLAAATVLGGIVAAFLEAHSQGERSASSAVVSKDRPNVLLVSVGGLRADHFNARQTPHMAALAEKGVRFQRAYVSLPRALPSLTTWLTGMVPHHHGLRQTFAKSEDLQRVQDALPRRLRRAGYRTELVTDGPLALASGLGWADEVPLDGPRTVIHALPALPFTAPLAVLPYAQWSVFQHLLPAQRFKASGDDPFAVAQQAIEALDELATPNAAGEGADGDPRPFFLTVSLSSPKFPYRSPAPYYRAFTSSSYRGPFKYQGMTSLSKEYKPNGHDREQVRRLYEGAVHAADEAVGRILDHLEAQGLASSTVVVLMSESGDALDEQGRGFGAGASLVGDEGTHVPLVIVDPRRPGGSSVDSLVRDVDLAPTLYDLTGVHPSGELDGQSLVAALEHKKLAATFAFAEAELPAASVRGTSVLPADPRAFVPRGRPGQPDALGEDEEEQLLVGRQRMVRDERWKLVYAPQRTGVKYMLFDTWQDPGETRDLAAAQGEQVERLRGVLWPWLRSDPRMVERGGLLVAKDTRPEVPARVPATTSADALKTANGNDSLPAISESPADEVAYRFVDRVAEAKVDAPRLDDTNRALRVHWRKMALPWTNLSDTDRSNVTSIALRTSPREVQRSFVRGTGARWSPDPRVWNLNEGTFDQRESLLAPTPATYSYALTVPPFAKFQVSPGLVDAGGREVRFRVVLRDAAGQEHELYAHRMGAADERHWVDATVDLGQFAGQNVVLSLLTTSEASSTPSIAASPWGTRLDIVGGVPEWSPHVPGVGVALWGNPVLLTKTKTRAAYNVLWVTVHGWRPDLLAAFHDAEEDRAKGQAERPAGVAWLAPTMGLLPSLERGVGEGVRFLSAYSAGTWERPSTLAMLAGTYPSEAGDDGAGWTLAREKAKKLYAQGQPLLPLVLRGAGVTTRAFGNAPSLAGYAPVGLDMGFERVQDYRYRGKDAEALTQDVTQWLAEHADERFFVYCHYGLSYDTDAKGGLPPGPPASVLAGKVQRYQQAMARTDRAVGQLLDALEKNHLKERTLVVLTADQGEMLSEVHGEVPSMDVVGRTPHPPDLYEEAVRIPLAMVLPGVLKRGLASTHPVRSVDIAPTVLGLLRLAKPTRMRGRSLVPLLLGGTVDEVSLPLVSEGGGRRGIRFGTYRYVRRESSVGVLSPATPLPPDEELYDLARDPGEMRNLVRSEPEKVAEMRARLAAALAHVPAADEAGALAEPASDGRSVLKIRVTGAGKVLPFRGSVHIKAPKWSSHGAHVSVKAVGLGDESWNLQGPRFDFAMTSSPNAVVGFDVAYEPAESAVEWSFYEDEKALPADHFFVGPFGVPSHGVRAGLFGEEAKDECLGAALPAVRPQVDRGLFVVCGPEKGFRTDGADPGGLGSGLDPTWMSSLGYGSPWRTVKK